MKQLLYLLLIIYTPSLLAINVDLDNTSYHHDKWGIQKSFGSTPILDIAILNENFLLISSQQGLFTFDGSVFAPYKNDIINNYDRGLFSIKVNDQGTIWAFHTNGLIKLEGSKSTNYTTEVNSSNFYNQLTLDALGNPWVIYNSSIFTLKNNKLIKVNSDQKYTSISTGIGNYTIVSYENSYSKLDYDGNVIESYHLKDLTTNIIYTLEDNTEKIWLISNNGVAYVKNNTTTIINTGQKTQLNNSHSIYKDFHGNIYFITQHKIYKFKDNKLFYLRHKLEKNLRIRGLVVDSHNNIWYGSWNKGLHRLKSTPLKFFSNAIENPVIFFNHRNNDKWIADYYQKVVIHKEDGDILEVEKFDSRNDTFIWDIEQGFEDEVLIAYSKGLVKFNQKGEIIQHYKQFDNKEVKRLSKDQNGNLWALINKVVYISTDKTYQNFIVFPELKDTHINIIVKSKNGLIFQNKKESYIYNNGKLTPYNIIETDRGYFYVITNNENSNEIWYVNINNNTLIRIKNNKKDIYYLDRDLISFSMYGLQLDTHNNLLAIGETGVVIFYRKWIDYYDRNRDSNDSIILPYKILLNPLQNSYECNGFDDALSIYKENIFITCNGGILKYVYERNDSPEIPKSQITKLAVNNKFIDLDTDSLTFKPPLTSLVFEFNAPNLNQTRSFQYRYRLNGIDTQWQYSNKMKSATYIQPNPGTYTFEVQSKSSETLWQSDRQSKIEFTVLPYFYQTNWFYWLLLVLIIFIIFLVSHLKTRLIRSEQRKLALIVEQKTKHLKKLQIQELEREQKTKIELTKQVLDRTKELKEQMKKSLLVEEQLRQSQKMEIIGHLTSGIAHDFNNMLAIIFLETEIIKNKFLFKNNKSIQQIVHAAEKCKEIIAQLLDFAKPDKHSFITTTLKKALEDSLFLINMALPETIQVNINLNDSDKLINLDLVKFHQIILNIMVNAKDACNNHGKIDIHSKLVTNEKKICSSCGEVLNGKFIKLSIKDYGKGIPNDNIKHIFKPFFSTKESQQGNGIGLQVVHSSIHTLGGHLQVKNNLSKGAEFQLFFPVSITPIKNKTDQKNNFQEKTYSKKIKMLLVEDSVTLAKSIKQLLAISNIEVDIAINGFEGLELFIQNKNKYDLIVTDNDMPQMDGITMIETIREINKNIPVLIFTGYQGNKLKRQIKKLNIHKIIQKPFNSGEFIDIIKETTFLKR